MHPGRPLLYVKSELHEIEPEELCKTFLIADSRTFHEDPRFGLVVLGEIASRALSPGINDPGTAIDVLGSQLRLFHQWNAPLAENEEKPRPFDRVAVPRISADDMLEDSFRTIARDGAGCIEVVLRLLKLYECLAETGHSELPELAREHARRTLERAEAALEFPSDLEAARAAARFAYA